MEEAIQALFKRTTMELLWLTRTLFADTQPHLLLIHPVLTSRPSSHSSATTASRLHQSDLRISSTTSPWSTDCSSGVAIEDP